MHVRPFPLFVLSLVAVFACSSNTAPTTVSGNWTYTAPSVAVSAPFPPPFGADTCSIAGLAVTIAQAGSSFTGTYASGTITCNDSVTALGSGTVVNGSISGSTISFEFDTHRYNATYHWANRGLVHGTTMSGTTSVLETANGSMIGLSGDWSAHQ